MVSTKGSEIVRLSESHKANLSADCSLEFDCMKMELLVMVDQNATVNMSLFLALTARHTMEAEVV